MISKLDRLQGRDIYENTALAKLNEVIDAVNSIQKEREAERFEIQAWIGILEEVRKSVNVHEKQIDELQMKMEPEKCETRAENVQSDTESRPVNVHAICPAVKYMGKVCRFWNGGNGKKFKNIGVLIEILSADNKRRYTCASKPKKHFEFCEPVKPDDDIIYKGE